jgi:hypothetical protein
MRREERRARRSLEQHSRRWPASPTVFLVLLLVFLAAILVLMFL